jgi:hypothetical protein
VYSTHSLTLALDGGDLSASRPVRFTPSERAPGTHWIGGWVGPRAVLDAVVKRQIPNSRRESNPRTPIVQLPLGDFQSITVPVCYCTLYAIDKQAVRCMFGSKKNEATDNAVKYIAQS